MQLQGVAYPLKFERGKIQTISGVAKVRSNITMLLDTTPGEIFMNPEYGCRLRWLVFEQEDTIFEALAQQYVAEAIQRWIPEVDSILSIKFEYEDNKVRMYIAFKLVDGIQESVEYDMERQEM